MEKMVLKRTAPMQEKVNQHKEQAEIIVESHSSEQWGQKLEQKPAKDRRGTVPVAHENTGRQRETHRDSWGVEDRKQ